MSDPRRLDGTTTFEVARAEDAFAPELLARIESTALLRFLAGRRWFGAKGRNAADARLGDVVRFPEALAAIAHAEVRFEDGEPRTWQLPLALVPEGDGAAIARVRVGGETFRLVDATGVPAFRAAIGALLASGGERRDGALSVRADLAPDPADDGRAALSAGESVVGSAEQSNTSMIFGGAVMVKLFRALEAGENPDAEIAAFLARTGFDGTPRLYGTLRLEHDGEPASARTLAIAQRYVAGSVDAWSHVLATGRTYFAAPASQVSPRNDVAAEAEGLGRATRALHDALASDERDPAFAPEPASADDVHAWGESAREQVEHALDLLERRLEGEGARAAWAGDADALVRRRESYEDWVEELVEETEDEPGMKLRHHGDYHLGQVLVSPERRFLIIDFEGEPARPLVERRRKHSPLRDVAGMLRSFAYAGATLASERRGALPPALLEPRSARWEREARDAFFRGYLAKGLPHHAPPDEIALRRLVSLFETEKVFYELAYELNNRPEWAWIPMRGISRLLVAPSTR